MNDSIKSFLLSKGKAGATVTEVAEHLGFLENLDMVENHSEITIIERKLRRHLRKIVDGDKKGSRTEIRLDQFNRPRKVYKLA